MPTGSDNEMMLDVVERIADPNGTYVYYSCMKKNVTSATSNTHTDSYPIS